MIKITDKVWIGNSADEEYVTQADLTYHGIGAILNVARDMVSTRGWNHGLEVMHVGLVDGPGNIPVTYVAAVLALRSLVQRHNVLVCCHSSSRSLAVVIMYLSMTQDSHTWPGEWRAGWDGWMKWVRSRVSCGLPEVHEAHEEAFNKITWSLLKGLMEG